MTKRQIGVGAVIAILIVVGIVVVSQHYSISSVPALVDSNTTAPKPKAVTAHAAVATVPAKSAAIGGLWVRPSAKVTARRYRRHGFAWILRQLGANEKLLDRFADEDLVGVLTELKAQAQAGDPAAVNILGEIAYRTCYLGRDAAVLNSYEASQVAIAKGLPPVDAEWVDAALREDIAYDKRVKAACNEVIDVDQALEWVKSRAKQGDGASLWLLSMSTSNLTEMQRLLRDAAAAGFPEAEFELAWAIIAGQQGAAGTGPDAVDVGDLLRRSAEQLPQAEAELAVCEYSGCAGITPDIASAVTHARDAAEKGSIDAMIAIGPHLSASQIAPDEVTAWKLVNASLQQRGCVGNGFSVQWMKDTTAALASPGISANARTLVDQYWRDYGSQMMANLGCTS
jgi:hypothetical protein